MGGIDLSRTLARKTYSTAVGVEAVGVAVMRFSYPSPVGSGRVFPDAAWGGEPTTVNRASRGYTSTYCVGDDLNCVNFVSGIAINIVCFFLPPMTRHCQAAHSPAGEGSLGGADPLGVHVEAFIKGDEDSRDANEEVTL